MVSPSAHRFGGGINRHFVFWFFVFFDPERSTLLQIVHDQELVGPQHRPFGEGEFSFDSAVGVRFERFFEQLFSLRIIDLDGEFLICKFGFVGLIVLAGFDPEFEFNRLFRTIDRPIGDGKDPGRLVFLVMFLSPPGMGKTGIGKLSGAATGDDQPLVVVG